jgi:RNA polymerase sigma-B factor
VEPAGETRELLRRWHDHADLSAREELVTRMLPLARSLARRYANKGEPLDDLEQVASVGLLKAIDRFDLDREVKFATFAVPTIAGEIKRHFRDRGWMLRVPREVQ